MLHFSADGVYRALPLCRGVIRVIRFHKPVVPVKLYRENGTRRLTLRSRRFIVLCTFLGIAVFGWLLWHNFLSRHQQAETPAITIEKQPVAFANHTFDPNSPPVDMPTLAYGEEAVCDSNLTSNAIVGGESQKTDSTHATVTITKVKMILALSINVWVPSGVTQHVVEHEDGHRQISEYYYQTADKLAERIAATYIGKQIDINGTDLDAQLETALHQTATDITHEFDQELSFAATQQYYDTITDHGRNESDVKEAVAAAVENVKMVSIQPPATTAK
jgi:hypothetical protein